MLKMFQGKNASSLRGKAIIKVKTTTTYVNVIDINVATRSKIIEDHVFKEKEPRKNKSTVDWKDEKLKKITVKTI
jgi:hypothetical protein